MKFRTTKGPHSHGGDSVGAMMLTVLLALAPAAVVHVWFFGAGLLINLFVAALTALGCEALMLRARGRPVGFHLSDYSAVVTAALIAFALPPLLPWWITAIGVAFAIMVAKHLYGGLGHNIFNPAMAGYVVLLVSFPEEMTRWPLPDLGGLDQVFAGVGGAFSVLFTGSLPAGLQWDAITGATPLSAIQSRLGNADMMSEIVLAPIFGSMAGAGWEWISLALLAGGLWLLRRGVISWHAPTALLGSLFLMSLLFFLIDGDRSASPIVHLLSGGTMLGAFFIATDPVSGASTPRGRLVFGAGTGLLTFVIRQWGSYPDGVGFAILLMNLAVPLIDRYTQPRIFGRGPETRA